MNLMRTAKILEATPLTRDSFALFGDVIETDGSRHFAINGGRATRFDDLAIVDTAEAGGLPAVSIFRSAADQFPVELRVMERHPWASQAIVPLNGAAYMVAVAPPGALDPAKIQVFLAGSMQGVNYRRGVWHHPLLALYRSGDFLVVDRKGAGDNCDVVDLDPALPIVVVAPQEGAH